MSYLHSAEMRNLQIADGGSAKAVIVLIESYVDESGTDPDDLAHVLAGYIIKPDHGLKMAMKWKAVLRKYDIPYFHMTDCAHYTHCEPYKSLGREKCINLAAELIWLIKVHCMEGFALCFSPKHYMLYNDESVSTRNAYTHSVNMVHLHIRAVLTQRNLLGHEISYTFEAGHRDRRHARAVLDKLVDDQQGKEEFAYSFQKKPDAVLLQAADILAWHCSTYIRRRTESKPLRKDFHSMLDIPHRIIHFYNPKTNGEKSGNAAALMFDNFTQSDLPETEASLKAIYLFDNKN